MAGFCTKCGAPLPSTTGFCPACGTAAGAGAVTPGLAPVPPAQAAPPAYGQAAAPGYQTAPGYSQVNAGGVPPAAAGYPAAYPAAQPASSGGTMKIVLIVVAVVVGLGLIGACVLGYTVWHTYNKVKDAVSINSKGDTASVSVPGGGTFSVGGDTTASDAELGVPAYPGATREKGGMRMNSGRALMVIAHFTTADSPTQVVEFYKSKMGDGTVAIATGNNDGTVLNSGGKDTDRIMVTVGQGTGNDAGKTTIVIMHTKKNGS